jgi:galactose-1-phosphate uridylyltransferase
LTGQRGIVAPPWDVPKDTLLGVVPLVLPVGTTPCPFCPGDADTIGTPSTTETARWCRDGRWSAAALLNRWPLAVEPTAHEVVVLTRRHDAHLLDLPLVEAELGIGLLLERAAVQRRAGRFPTLYANHGLLAGSSQPHAHAQVLGLDGPDSLALGEAGALGRTCLLCTGRYGRLVAATPGARIVVPDVARTSYSQIVVLDEHGDHVDRAAMALGIATALRALWGVTGPVAYNLLFHDRGHPHVHVVPRIAYHSGLDLAGLYLSFAPNAVVASRLRSALGQGENRDDEAFDLPMLECHGS